MNPRIFEVQDERWVVDGYGDFSNEPYDSPEEAERAIIRGDHDDTAPAGSRHPRIGDD